MHQMQACANAEPTGWIVNLSLIMFSNQFWDWRDILVCVFICNQPYWIINSKSSEVLQHEDECARCNQKSSKLYVMGGLPHKHGSWVQGFRLGYCHQTMDSWFELTILFWFPNPQLTPHIDTTELRKQKQQKQHLFGEFDPSSKSGMMWLPEQTGWLGPRTWQWQTFSKCPKLSEMQSWSVCRAMDGKAFRHKELFSFNFIFPWNEIKSKNLWVLCSIYHYAATMSGSPFSDESLQSKKLLPNFNHKSPRSPKGSLWQTRLKNTDQSCLLTMRMVASQWSNLKPSERNRPLLRQQLEEKCQVCALACHLHLSSEKMWIMGLGMLVYLCGKTYKLKMELYIQLLGNPMDVEYGLSRFCRGGAGYPDSKCRGRAEDQVALEQFFCFPLTHFNFFSHKAKSPFQDLPIICIYHFTHRVIQLAKFLITLRAKCSQSAPRFLDRLEKGDLTLEMDLLGAIEARSEAWLPRENACSFSELRTMLLMFSFGFALKQWS